MTEETQIGQHRPKMVVMDYSKVFAITETESRVCLTYRQIAIILSQLEYVRWRTRWSNLPEGVGSDQLGTIYGEIHARLTGACPVDCAEIEDCLETSAIINTIEGDIVNINIEVDALTDVTSEVYNVYPQAPTPTDADLLCSAAVYVAQKLSAFWHQVITDAQTITWDEFVENLIPGGGNDVGLAKLLWDYIVSNSNPNLVAEGDAAFSEVVGYLFCNEFDHDLTDLDIDASPTMTADAKALWRGALKSFTDGKISQWLYIGSLKGLSSSACVCDTICGYLDFRTAQHSFVHNSGAPGIEQWTLNTGFAAVPDTGIGNDWNQVYIQRTFTARNIRRLVMTFDLDEGRWDTTNGVNAQIAVTTKSGGAAVTNTVVNYNVQPDGLALQIESNVADNLVDEIELLVRAAQHVDITPDVGYARIISLLVECTP
jgi:hypothetical protein